MVHAFVFVDAAAGTAEPLVDELREIDPIQEAHVVAGNWDLVLELETEEVHDVLATVTAEVRPLDGIGTTRTYISLD